MILLVALFSFCPAARIYVTLVMSLPLISLIWNLLGPLSLYPLFLCPFFFLPNISVAPYVLNSQAHTDVLTHDGSTVTRINQENPFVNLLPFTCHRRRRLAATDAIVFVSQFPHSIHPYTPWRARVTKNFSSDQPPHKYTVIYTKATRPQPSSKIRLLRNINTKVEKYISLLGIMMVFPVHKYLPTIPLLTLAHQHAEKQTERRHTAHTRTYTHRNMVSCL